MLCGWSEDIKVEILPVFRMSSARMPEGKAATEGKSETLPQQGGGGGDKTLAPK